MCKYSPLLRNCEDCDLVAGVCFYDNGPCMDDRQDRPKWFKEITHDKKEGIKNPFDKQIGGVHYKKEGVPDVTEWCMLHNIPLAEFNIIKYVFRHGKKGKIEDLRKAQHYLEFIAFMNYKENL